MAYLYYSANARHRLVKIGVSKRKTGAARIKDYAHKHDLPRDGWAHPRHFQLTTMRLARWAEIKVHQWFRGRARRRHRRLPREVFRSTRSNAHWCCLAVVRVTGGYLPGR